MQHFDLENLQFALLCFSSLFTLINPIGILPIYLTMTQNLSRLERTQINKQGLITAGMILLLFAFVGDYIFSIYDVTIEAFKIAGGIIFFRIGLTNLESKVSRMQCCFWDDKFDTFDTFDAKNITKSQT